MKNMEIKMKFKPNPEYHLMDQVREVLRYYHYAYMTEQSYSSWILQYIKFYGDKTHRENLGEGKPFTGKPENRLPASISIRARQILSGRLPLALPPGHTSV